MGSGFYTGACIKLRAMPKISARAKRRLLGLSLAAVAALAGALALLQWLTHPVPQALHLADGTDVFFLSNTKIAPAAGYPDPREIRIDGEAFLRVAAAARPLI